jgi:protein SCO1
MKNTLMILAFFALLLSCQSKSQPESKPDTKAVVSSITDESIFNLTSKWKTEEGKEIELADLKGKVLVMVMIYTTCRVACPRLVADMSDIANQISADKKQDVQYVLVSIDPENDTPEKLKKFAIEKNMDGAEWTFLQGNVNTVQEFANVLSVKYKQIAPMDFSHSNIISVFDRQGVLIHQQEGLGVNNKETVEAIIEAANQAQ